MDFAPTILVINSGSSSVKFALFDVDPEEPNKVWSGIVDRIGLGNAHFVVKDIENVVLAEESLQVSNHSAALNLLLDWANIKKSEQKLIAVGHRVVHGGESGDHPMLITAELEANLKRLIPLAPLHLPHNLVGIEAIRLRWPQLPQVACFDTTFHHGLPAVAQRTGLPRRFEGGGVRRYGFHGLSYEYVIEDVRRRDGEVAANARIIVAHLGNGASMAAIKKGRGIETTMGFSTLAGLPMGTRSGDLDPGLLLYLLIEKHMTPEDARNLLYNASGLLGLSGLSGNMKDLLARSDETGAAEAIEFFCYRARKHLAALTAALGGLDRLIFTGGIGANSPDIRGRICAGLDFLGLKLDDARNADNEHALSADDGRVLIEAVKTDEELVIARHTWKVLQVSSAIENGERPA